MGKKEITVLPCSEHLDGIAEWLRDIVYASPQGKDLTMQVLRPWRKDRKYPLVVFVQGSAWTTPNPGYELPQLGALAMQGFVVAAVEHRDCREGNPFPAFLQDVKTAIRFLRAHAEEYNIDKNRVGMWGTSSGGNIALLVGMTGDWDCYRTEEYEEESDQVQAVVDCFGPTDIVELARIRLGVDLSAPGPYSVPEGESNQLAGLLYDGQGGISPEKARQMSPLCIAAPNQSYPPFLILHGDADATVPYKQSETLYEKLTDLGYDARMVRVTGAVHEDNFWTPRLHHLICDYFKETL